MFCAKFDVSLGFEWLCPLPKDSCVDVFAATSELSRGATKYSR